MVATMAITQQFAKYGNSESTVVSATLGSSFLGTLFWLAISAGLLISAAFGMASVIGCALRIITGAMS